MAGKHNYRKIFARIAASAGVLAFLCLYALFVTTAEYISDKIRLETVNQMYRCAEYKASDADSFFYGVKGFHGGFPENEKVIKLPPVSVEPEVLKTAAVYNVSYYLKYSFCHKQREFSCSARSRENIVSNIKNDFYCRI